MIEADYDTIIVGGGSVGATLAARLSADPATRVLLREAGQDLRTTDTPEHIQIPNPTRAIADDAFRWPAAHGPAHRAAGAAPAAPGHARITRAGPWR